LSLFDVNFGSHDIELAPAALMYEYE